MSELTPISSQYDTVLFDMDGTLLDLAFDYHIWMQRVPELWAQHENCTLDEAKTHLYQFYLQHQGSLNWYSSKFWQNQLGIDVLDLQTQNQHLIQVRQGCFDLLDGLKQSGVEIWLVTNADVATLALKLSRIPLASYFKHVVSSELLGYPKEQQQFWQKLNQLHSFDPARTAFIDDNYDVLESAKNYGIRGLFSILEPDSKQARRDLNTQFIHLDHLTDLLNILKVHKDI